MNEIVEFLKVAGLFAGGMFVRLLLLVLVVALYSIPIFLAWGVYRLYQKATGRAVGLEPVDGLLLASGRHYTPGHAWLEPRLFQRLRVGLDDIGQRILPGANVVSLPHVGATVIKGEPAVLVSSGDRETSIPSPVDGTVTSINPAFRKSPSPGLLNRAPYTRGWLFTVKPNDATWAHLPTGGAARDWFRLEEHRFAHFLEAELGMAAADGGEMLIPGPTALPRAKWEAMVTEFLHH
ncbi:MAG TPA: glycine cleavage system protein H [Thermoanaerobaculia bacterium]